MKLVSYVVFVLTRPDESVGKSGRSIRFNDRPDRGLEEKKKSRVLLHQIMPRRQAPMDVIGLVLKNKEKHSDI
jgi:hypothetical protein